MATDGPPPSSSSAAPSSGGSNLRSFLWLSDVHMDPRYGTPLAFAASYYEGVNCFDDADAPLGKYGCDGPPALFAGALDAAVAATTTTTTTTTTTATTATGGGGGGGGVSSGPPPAFVIVTGDAVRHGVDQIFSDPGLDFAEGGEARSDGAVAEAASATWHDRAMAEAGGVMGEVASMIRVAFPDAVVVVCLGNNDVVPDYYLELPEYGEGGAAEGGGGGGGGGGVVAMMPTPETAGMLGVMYDALGGGSADANDDDDDDGSSSSSSSPSILTSSDAPTFLRGGYYVRMVHDGSLAILSLNTVLYSSFYGPYDVGVDDPGGQFGWMRTILSDCRASADAAASAGGGGGGGPRCSAMIVGHVPPAMGSYRHQQMWRERYIRTYYDIVKEFDDVVMAQLFGHLHSDEFRVGLDEGGPDDGGIGGNVTSIPTLSTPLLLGPSVTPLHGNDPSFRVVRYDHGGRRGGGNATTDDGGGGGDRYRIVDYDSYAHSMAWGGGGGDVGGGGWSKLYTFSEVYGDVASGVLEEEGLSSGTFRAIVGAMEDGRWGGGGENPTLGAYRSFKLSGARKAENQFGDGGTCDSRCRDDYMCVFGSATAAGYDTCMLERGETWYRVRGDARVIVAGVLFSVAIAGIAFVRCRRIWRGKREHYDFAPSVHEEVKDDGIDVHDREMI